MTGANCALSQPLILERRGKSCSAHFNLLGDTFWWISNFPQESSASSSRGDTYLLCMDNTLHYTAR